MNTTQGPYLDDVELENGIRLAWENANSLIQEAKLLMEHEHYCRAYTIFQLASEEFGKCQILMYCLIQYYSGFQIDEKYINDCGFTNHQLKYARINNFIVRILEIPAAHELKPHPLYSEFLSDIINVKAKDRLKNLSLYVSIINGKFALPENQISKTDVIQIQKKVNSYRIFIKFFIEQPISFFEMLAQLFKEYERKDKIYKKQPVFSISDKQRGNKKPI